MRTVVEGRIVDFVPSFAGHVDEDGILVAGGDAEFALAVDTGFNGGVALPEEVLDRMDVHFLSYDTFTLATGDVVELPIFVGGVKTGGRGLEMSFIPGDWLLGMEFLSSAGSVLSLDFEKRLVSLAR